VLGAVGLLGGRDGPGDAMLLRKNNVCVPQGWENKHFRPPEKHKRFGVAPKMCRPGIL